MAPGPEQGRGGRSKEPIGHVGHGPCPGRSEEAAARGRTAGIQGQPVEAGLEAKHGLTLAGKPLEDGADQVYAFQVVADGKAVREDAPPGTQRRIVAGEQFEDGVDKQVGVLLVDVVEDGMAVKRGLTVPGPQTPYFSSVFLSFCVPVVARPS